MKREGWLNFISLIGRSGMFLFDDLIVMAVEVGASEGKRGERERRKRLRSKRALLCFVLGK